MEFEYHPDVDALYIRLNPGREPKGQGDDTVVIGDGFVVDVDAEGEPIGIDIHQDASKVVDLSKQEAKDIIFGLVPAKDSHRRVS